MKQEYIYVVGYYMYCEGFQPENFHETLEEAQKALGCNIREWEEDAWRVDNNNEDDFHVIYRIPRG